MAESINPNMIGSRARVLRTRRGLTLTLAADRAGISKSYLSQLETGRRKFDGRGLIEAVADALGCSVVDLTGQPYLPVDRASADALTAVPGIRTAIYDMSPDDAPEGPTRPLADIARAVRQANLARDGGQFAAAGGGLGALLSELHSYTAHHGADDRREALRLMVEACHVAGAVTAVTGYHDLALECAVREWEAAQALGDDRTRAALAGYGLAQTWMQVGARRRAHRVLSSARQTVDETDLVADDTGPAQMAGMVYLASALLASRERDESAVGDYIGEARRLAERTGERNTALQHFGPTNVALWDLTLKVELGHGTSAADHVQQNPIDVKILRSRDRAADLALSMARGWAQADGARDTQAIQALDAADRSAPVKIRNNPVARELLSGLYGRSRTSAWELESLRNRFRLAE